MSDYQQVKALWADLQPFKPLVPVDALPGISFGALVSAFAIIFYLTTLPTKFNATEVPLALAAAGLVGIGTVALFCAVGVPV